MQNSSRPAETCVVKVPNISSKRYLSLSTVNRQIVRSLMMTIAIEQWEIYIRTELRKKKVKAYQDEKKSRVEVGSTKKVLIENDTTFSIFLYKIAKKQIDGFNTMFVSVTIEQRFEHKFTTCIPTVNKLTDYFSKHQIEKLPKSVRKFLLSERNQKKD